MFVVQVVLLNLLIALMGEARAKAANEATLNAFRRRAELVLEQEQKCKAASDVHSPFGIRRVIRTFQAGGNDRPPRDQERWLHVLVPDEIDALNQHRAAEALDVPIT